MKTDSELDPFFVGLTNPPRLQALSLKDVEWVISNPNVWVNFYHFEKLPVLYKRGGFF